MCERTIASPAEASSKSVEMFSKRQGSGIKADGSKNQIFSFRDLSLFKGLRRRPTIPRTFSIFPARRRSRGLDWRADDSHNTNSVFRKAIAEKSTTGSGSVRPFHPP